MIDIPEAEAVALLADPLICPEAPGWVFNKLKPGLAILECGLVHQDGARTGLQIQLQFLRSHKTKQITFKFTVFKLTLGSPHRVYQLHVTAASRAPKNWHDMAHEHMGAARIPGSQEWLLWDFMSALDYFSARANITFVPAIEDPEAFKLTS